MSDPIFFSSAGTATLADIVAWTAAAAPENADLSIIISAVAPLDEACQGTLSFLDNPKYIDVLETTRASACFIEPRFAAHVPKGTVALLTPEPHRAFALAVAGLFPSSLRPESLFGSIGVNPGASVHPEARLEAGVIVDPGAVIGPHAEIGSGSIIGANAVIGPNVRLGRDCSIGAQVTLMNALIGNRVIIHPGARIGQDGFGFARSARGHLKVPQIGRVIIQDDVEIGANTTVDRGANRDTVIGEGTKIDNLVQIAHNVTIGRHCLIIAQVGISGSTELGDFVAAGGQAGLAGHLEIGAGAQIAAQSGVMNNVPAKERWGGTPARPIRKWLRAQALLDRLAGKSCGTRADKGADDTGK
jgi:UDP-3-O-[3-hydroxymyristoyl] glucosamine N-acyltransferase